MKIVRMEDCHVAQIAALERQCFSSPWSEASVSSELNNPLALWLVALDGETVAGYIGSQTVAGESDMMNVAVDPQYRRQGIGRALVEELVHALQEKESTCLTLEVRASNAAAIALYQQLGFVQVGCRKNYYRAPKEDALILRREIAG